MEETGLAFGNDVTAWIGHGDMLAGRSCHDYKKKPRSRAGNFRYVSLSRPLIPSLSRNLPESVPC